MYTYQKTQRYFAQAANDVLDLAGNELISLGAEDIQPAYRGLHFKASPQCMYSINLNSRLINRVLAPLITFDCHSENYLYKTASQIAWSDFISADQTLAVFASVSHSNITHSRFAALRVKDAIVDSFRHQNGRRPSIDTRNPDLWVNLHLENNRAVLSIDTSGGSLHRRGYRRSSVAAPMIETLAAAIVDLMEWDTRTPILDPFCGSGTLLCEAWLKATRTPPGILRNSFGFQHLPDFDATLWQQVKSSALSNIEKPTPGLLSGSDIDPEAVRAARTNCGVLAPEYSFALTVCDIFSIPELKNTILVCNPPYGIRLGHQLNLEQFYSDLGDFLKQKATGCTAYIYFGERRFIKNIGLHPTWKKPLANGALDGRLTRFDLY